MPRLRNLDEVSAKVDFGPSVERLIRAQLDLIDRQQSAMCGAVTAGHSDLAKLETLSRSIHRAVEAVAAAQRAYKDIADQLTPSQLVDALIRKLEVEDVAVLGYAIRRLVATRRQRLGGRPGTLATDPETRTVAEEIWRLGENE